MFPTGRLNASDFAAKVCFYGLLLNHRLDRQLAEGSDGWWLVDRQTGWAKMVGSQGTVANKGFERTRMGGMEFDASDDRGCGVIGRGFSALIQPWLPTGSIPWVQTNWLTKTQQQT